MATLDALLFRFRGHGKADAAPPTAATVLAARQRRRRWLTGFAVVVLLGASILAWRLFTRAAAVDYVTAPITRGAITRAVTASGTVNPQTTVQVGAFVSGAIQSISCDYNTEVKKGQVCAKIDPRPYQTAIDQDRANLAASQAQLQKDRANLTLQQRNYQRAQALQAQGLLSQDQFDAARANYDEAQAQIGVDQSSVTQHSAALEAAQVNLGYTSIVSPVDGTVVSRNVTVGQTVAASFQTPTLFLIATDLTKMQVDTNVSEGDIGDIKEGAPAAFTVEAFSGRRFDATVTQVRQAPETVQNVVTYDVVVTVPNPELLLKPGMTANMRIITDRRDNVLRVPDQALRYTPGGLTARPSASAAPAPSLPGLGGGARLGGGRGGGGGGRNQGGAGRGEGRGRGGQDGGTHTATVYVLRDGQPAAVPATLGLDDDTNSELINANGSLQEGDSVIVSEKPRGAAH